LSNRVKLLLAASALLCFAASAAAQSTRTDRAAIANGESVYLALGCQSCHGTVGHGGAARRLAPGTLPLEAFVAWVRNGTPGWSFAAGMPAFPASAVSDADLADIRSYLASLPPPPPLADIPLLSE
jgi:mono/diheme cytochrome c family protein